MRRETLIELMERRVSSAEDDVRGKMRTIRWTLERVEHNLRNGTRLNDLGEMQGAGAALDVAIARRHELMQILKILEGAEE